MFYVKHIDGECDPILRCHVCASTIEHVPRSMVVYERTTGEGETARVAFVHGEDCLPKAMNLLTNEHGAPQTIRFDEFIDRLRKSATVHC
jgi:hypothetical protein